MCGSVLCLVVGLLSAAPPAGAVGGYGDVDPDAYFAPAVQWSVDNGILTGDDACFLPHAPITRAEAAVSLWDIQGRPAAPRHLFIDVGSDKSLNGAVSWMTASGITTGTSRRTFSPDALITRAQIGAFLHRLEGSPPAPPHRFTDVPSEWMHAPVSWMTAEGITTGVSAAQFAPRQTLTRAQLATFLYRYQGQPDVTVDPTTEQCCLRTSADTDPCGLAAELDWLVRLAEDWDSTVEIAVSVILHDGSEYSENADEHVPSASSVKPVWTAAAIDVAGLEAVAPLAPAALVRSDNYVAGNIIDLAGGIDAVNAWSKNVAGMQSTHLAHWRYGTTLAPRFTTGWPRTTTNDLAQFYARLHSGELLAPEATAQLADWLRATPRRLAYVQGAILDRLPESASTEALQKLGWLPGGADLASHTNAITGGALVPLPDGEWFAIALSTTNSAHYRRSIIWLGFAACRVYVLLVGGSTNDCVRPGDPPLQ